ncbi:Sugar or nucleoside kinase, ribokinase family [[Eubacterium] yurii]|nr:Sugar or nucleoside kinase, ribokinase family [[Eubacterium] yurii]
MKETGNSRDFFKKKNSNFLNKQSFDTEVENCSMSNENPDYIEINDIEVSDTSKKNLIFCIGAANVDYKLIIENKVIMETSNPAQRITTYGGVARNIAENLARLDEEVALMTKVGNDLEGTNVVKDASPIMHIFATDRDQIFNTGTYFAVLDESRNLVLGLADMKICDTMDGDWITSHEEHIKKADIIVCDTNVQKSAIEKLQNIKDRKIILIGVSVAKTAHIPDQLKNIYLAILNKDEATAYSQCDKFEFKSVCDKLKKKGLDRCIITMGKDGCIFYEEKISPVVLSAEMINDVIDVTGAGDSFSAGVIHGISKNESLETACKYGMKMAQLNLKSDESVVKNIPSDIFDNIDTFFDISYDF